MIDPSIPLQINPPQFDITKLSELARVGQQMKTQNALKQILANPGATDPATGLPTDQAIAQISKVDPQTGMKMAMTSAEIKQRMQEGKLEEWKTYQPLVKAAKDSLANILQPDIDKFGLEKAVEMHRGDYADTLKDLTKQGLPANLLGAMPQELSPQVASMLVAQSVTPEKKAELADHAATRKTQSDRLGETTRHDKRMEDIAGQNANTKADAGDKKGWQLYQTPDGNAYRANANTGKAQKMGEDGEWQDIDKLPASVGKPGTQPKDKFTPKMGDLMAALAEQGVALPTGFRSKEQQMALYQGILDRNPDMSADQIATKVKTGEIEFGAQKKETQTAANVAGRVEVFQNELTKSIPLVREASAAVPRGKWVPLNKLMQMTDGSISDPGLKKLKVYVNSTLNAYDGLAARGGTDVKKREEAHNLLMTADGPEALNAALDAFGKEAEIAHSAAVEATKVPELAGPKAGAAQPKQHAVGDIIVQGGKRYKASAVDKDGKVTAAEEVP